jgi:hypothetical protein
MVVNDDAGSLTPSGVLELIASRLAPTGEGRCLLNRAQKKRPEPVGASDVQRCG